MSAVLIWPGRGADEIDVPLEQVADGVKGIEIERVARRHEQAGLGDGNGDDLVAPGGLAGQQVDDLLRDGDLAEIDKVHAGGAGQRAAHILVADGPLLDERLDEAALRGGLLAGAVELRLGDEPGIEQDFGYVIVVVDHWRELVLRRGKNLSARGGAVNARDTRISGDSRCRSPQLRPAPAPARVAAFERKTGAWRP